VIVAIFRRTLRSDDVIVRWGGEEFLAILPETQSDRAAIAAEHLRAAVAASEVVVGGKAPFALTVSIGVAEARSLEPGDLIGRADAALCAAKSEGRNRVVTDWR
jgi:diguanylate cyclase (GGDEF)-like protein